MDLIRIAHPLPALVLSPLLLGVVNRTKAFFAGRVGPPLLQPYFDLWKLLQKGAVYSRTTTWIFRAGPVVGLATVLLATAIMPLGGRPAPVAFAGDFILFAYLLALMRFVTVLAALDTGSAFEGMGASREVQFSALVEPVLLLGLAAIARKTGCLSLSAMYAAGSANLWANAAPALGLVAVAFLIVFLVENARIPVDDPNTHLELTMIHEVMVLDHSGPDLAFIFYGSAIKLWLLGSLVVGIVVPVHSGSFLVDGAAAFLGLLGIAVLTGIIESSMARLRLVTVPQLIVGAGVLAGLSFAFLAR